MKNGVDRSKNAAEPQEHKGSQYSASRLDEKSTDPDRRPAAAAAAAEP